MDDKISRLFWIFNKLANREPVTLYAMMDEFSVSERAVYRYISTLRRAGISIDFDRAKKTYALQNGFSVAKSELTTKEAFSLKILKLVAGGIGGSMANEFEHIENRLIRRRPDTLPRTILTAAPMSDSGYEKLGAIHQAVTDYLQIEIVYRALYSDEETTRTVDPYYLFINDGFWHLRGYCGLRKEFRTFALDRIQSLRILDNSFIPRMVAAEDEVHGSFGGVVDGEPVTVVLRFDPEIVPYATRKRWHRSQTETLADDNRLEMTFRVNGYEGMKEWIYRWLPHVEVVSPPELVAEVRNDLIAAIKRHDETAGA
jgi:predicted DNA-binding transcriptional regulator YafY